MSIEGSEEGIPMKTDAPSQRDESYDEPELQQVEITPEVSRQDGLERTANIRNTPTPKEPKEDNKLGDDPDDMWQNDKGRLH